MTATITIKPGDTVIYDATDSTPNWPGLAERLLDQALAELRNDDDAVATASAALAALTACDRTAAEQEELWQELSGEPDELPCTCPPDLVERGGFTSVCPTHGR